MSSVSENRCVADGQASLPLGTRPDRGLGAGVQGTLMVRAILLTSASAAALGACATSYQAAGRDPYAAALYTGAEQLTEADIRATQFPPAQRASNGAPLELVSFEGIEGARRAHKLYTRAEAEALDGRCERFIEPAATETLDDIADLCDVPLDTLVAYNPAVKNISYAERVVTVEIPGGKVKPTGTFAASDALASLYEVQAGDSLETIAYRLNVSMSALANSNPDVTWTMLTPGQLLQKPAAATAPVTAAPYAAPAETAWQGWTGNGPSAAAGGVAGDVRHAPYTLRPTRPFAGRDPGTPAEGVLLVDKPAVRAGDRIKVTARVQPGEEVTFYSGETAGAANREVARVRADDEGQATASIRVRRKSDMGGVIFKAVPGDSGQALYSDRIGVLNLEGDKSKDDSLDEAVDE